MHLFYIYNAAPYYARALLEFVFISANGTFEMPGLVLTEAQKVDLPQLEPALESLLRSADLDENLIELFRFRKNLDRQLFVALDADEQAIISWMRTSSIANSNSQKSAKHGPLRRYRQTQNERWMLYKKHTGNQSSS